MEKRGQLGIIEFKFFIIGLFIGIVVGWVLVYLGANEIMPNFLSWLYS